MSVNIRIPSIKGDTQKQVCVSEAQNIVSDYMQRDWIVAVNGDIAKTESRVNDGDKVVILPHIIGG